MYRYLVVFEKTATGYSTYVPDLPGCVATGETKEQAEENIYQAILLHLEELKEESKSIPESVTESEILVIPQ